VVGKILDTLRVEHSLGARWQGLPRPAEDEGTAAGAARSAVRGAA
jgi:hypothetical protein